MGVTNSQLGNVNGIDDLEERCAASKLRIEKHKKFFVGWSHTCHWIPFTQEKNVTITIIRITRNCIYYTKTENGVVSKPIRRVIKTTGDENGFGGIQYFDHTEHFEVMATYNIWN
jgi:hypothetical protein